MASFFFLRMFCNLFNEELQTYVERKPMFILLTLFTMLVILTIFLIVGVASAGAAFLIVFGDIVVAVVFIAMLIKHILKKRSK